VSGMSLTVAAATTKGTPASANTGAAPLAGPFPKPPITATTPGSATISAARWAAICPLGVVMVVQGDQLDAEAGRTLVVFTQRQSHTGERIVTCRAVGPFKRREQSEFDRRRRCIQAGGERPAQHREYDCEDGQSPCSPATRLGCAIPPAIRSVHFIKAGRYS